MNWIVRHDLPTPPVLRPNQEREHVLRSRADVVTNGRADGQFRFGHEAEERVEWDVWPLVECLDDDSEASKRRIGQAREGRSVWRDAERRDNAKRKRGKGKVETKGQTFSDHDDSEGCH